MPVTPYDPPPFPLLVIHCGQSTWRANFDKECETEPLFWHNSLTGNCVIFLGLYTVRSNFVTSVRGDCFPYVYETEWGHDWSIMEPPHLSFCMKLVRQRYKYLLRMHRYKRILTAYLNERLYSRSLARIFLSSSEKSRKTMCIIRVLFISMLS